MVIREIKERIAITNQIIKEKNLNWVAGLNSISILSDEEKRMLCGALPITEEEIGKSL